MAPAHDAVLLRRNNQVQDAIDGQNLKQALQLIEKRMKKGEDTRFLKVSRCAHQPLRLLLLTSSTKRETLTIGLQAWKAHIHFLHADDANKQRGIKETLELCNAQPPTTDLETLEKLFRTLKKLDGHAETRSSLWEKAAKAKPQDLEIQLEWFNSAYESDDWKSAQKVCQEQKLHI